MLKKFPFGDSILKDLGVLQPDKAPSYSASTILSLAKRFPQIGLSDSEKLDQIVEEFNDFLLSPNDLPKPDISQKLLKNHVLDLFGGRLVELKH